VKYNLFYVKFGSYLVMVIILATPELKKNLSMMS